MQSHIKLLAETDHSIQAITLGVVVSNAFALGPGASLRWSALIHGLCDHSSLDVGNHALNLGFGQAAEPVRTGYISDGRVALVNRIQVHVQCHHALEDIERRFHLNQPGHKPAPAKHAIMFQQPAPLVHTS